MYNFSNYLFIGFIVMLIYYFTTQYNINGPCLAHCYKKYNVIQIFGFIIFGYLIGKYYKYI
jgi:hypothetical protein